MHFDGSGLLEQIPVVMIDTLHLFPETYEHVLNVTRRYPTMRLGDCPVAPLDRLDCEYPVSCAPMAELQEASRLLSTRLRS